MGVTITMTLPKEKNMKPNITEQLAEIKEQVCTQLCKWPNIWDEEEEGMELIDSEHCQNCPLNRMWGEKHGHNNITTSNHPQR